MPATTTLAPQSGAKSPGTRAHFSTVESMIDALAPGYPVYCLRPRELQRIAGAFLENFPGRVLYAVKCNPHLDVLRTLYAAGIRHFDTASLTEIATIREHFPRADCYFMHPVKARAAIQTAHEVYRVDHYVIDHARELEKVVAVTGGGNAQVVLVRVATPQADATYALSDKFGAQPDEAVALLRQVEKEGYQTGLAFHVGSQCRDPESYVHAIEMCAELAAKADVRLHYLDVGGGFPVHYVDDTPPGLPVFFSAIKQAVAKARLRGDCVLMCEPGRAMVASGSSIVVQVQLRKNDRLYINDGIYHSLGETLTGSIKLPARQVGGTVKSGGPTIDFEIFGPTCDSTDVLPYRFTLPADIEEGQWIEIGQVGAYSNAMTSQFNGFKPETFVTVDAPPLITV